MTSRLLTFSFALLCFLALGRQLEAQGRIGFVDLQEVILRYKSTQRISQELEDAYRERRNLLRQQRESLRVKKEGLSALQGDELATIKLLKEIRQEEESIKIEEQWFLRQIETKRANHVKKVYVDVLSTVADIGQRNRMSAIFLVQKGEIAGETSDAVEANILVRPVLWHDSRLDLTAQVIQALNK